MSIKSINASGKPVFRLLTIDRIFQGLNGLFVLIFVDNLHQISYKQYFLPAVEIENYKVTIDGKNFFDQLVKMDLKAYDNIGKFGTGEGDDYTTGCLLDHNYFKDYYKMIATYSVKQQPLDADPKAIQQIHFTEHLDWNATVFFIIEEAKETFLDFSQGTMRVLWIYFAWI